MTPLEISEPIRGTVSAPQSSIDHRDEVLAASKEIVSVATPEELETAVAALRELTAITKETEAARKTIKAPVTALGKTIDNVAEVFVAPVEKDKLRITGLINAFQRKQLEAQQAAERAARAEQEKAQREAAEAQHKIEEVQRKLASEELSKKQRAQAEADLLKNQLAAEEAEMNQQAARLELTAPTSTPRGLTTRVRYDFEIYNTFASISKMPELWLPYDTGTVDSPRKNEALKFDRAGFLKALNNGAIPHRLLPEETQQSVTHTAIGIRIYRDVSTFTRA